MASAVVEREQVAEGVAGIVLNRPDKLNAINLAVFDELIAAVEEIGQDDESRVIVIRGAGRAFSVGADASGEGVTRTPSANASRFELLDDGWGRLRALWDCPKPVMVQVHGYCLGIATVLCNFADIVVTADDAVIGWPSLPLGGGVIGPSWTWYVGAHKAKELSFQSGSRLSGTEAAALGWANRAVPADDLAGDVRAQASRIAVMPPGLLRLKKEAINRIYDQMGFRDAMRLGATWAALAHTDPGTAEMLDLVRAEGIKGAMRHFQPPTD